MRYLTTRRSEKAGLPPGTLVHIGERRLDQVVVRCMVYDETRFEERHVEVAEGCIDLAGKSGVTWVDVCGLHDVDMIEQIGKQLHLHPLTLEDVLHTGQRPKLEDFDDYIYVVLKMFYFDEEARRITQEQVSLILGSNYVLSIQEMEKDVFDAVRDRIRKSKGRLRRLGPDYLLYALLDATVDSYFSILERIGQEVETIEDEMLNSPGTETLHQVHELKREMILLRKSVWPLREVIGSLERDESELVQESTQLFLRDVYDHTIQAAETVETYRDMLSGMLDLYLSSVSNRMNDVMKVLTIIATVFIPLTFIAGIYGMNFEYMPELRWPWGYLAVWVVMIAIGLAMLIYFRRKRWL